MAFFSLHKEQDKALNDFSREYRVRTLNYLRQVFSLQAEDCEDIFQEASIVLCLSAKEGKLDNLNCSLYTYFIGICRNKAFEQLRKKKKMPELLFEDVLADNDHESYLNRADKLLQIVDEDEDHRNNCQTNVQLLVEQLPPPCNELLWAYYRDTLSMKTIANMFGYAFCVKSVCLVFYEVPQKLSAGECIFEKHYTTLPLPICGVHHNDNPT